MVTVAKAVQADFKRLEGLELPPGAEALMASALELARRQDNRKNSATSVASCARAMREALDRLWELVPADEEADRVDDLAARRARRRAKAKPAASS